MSFRTEAYTQSTTEITTYTVDFTNDLPTGGTVTAGTATHIPPSGTALPLTVTVNSPYVYVTVPEALVLGTHYVDVLATLSDNDKASVRIVITAVYPTPTAREGMADIITRLRRDASAGLTDYEIAGETYWSDAQLQDILDKRRTNVMREQLASVAEAAGTKRYFSGCDNFESGTAVFWLEDSTGATVSEALYTADYQNGEFTFTSDTGGAVYYLTGRSYDLHAAAAAVWEAKAGYYAVSFDFSSDGHSMHRSQVIKHCTAMAEKHRQQSRAATRPITLTRDDCNAWDY